MITEIKKGDRFRCTKKHITGLNRNGITKVTEVFTEDKVYTSHKDCCLLGNNDIPFNLYSSKSLADANEFMNMYFTKLNSSNFHANTFNTIPLGADPDTQQDLTREAIEQDEMEREVSRQFDTGSKRDNDDDKPLVNHIDPYTRLRFGHLLRAGAKKYGISNWRLGQPTETALESLHRHLAKFELNLKNGIEQDEDHIMSCIFNLQLIAMNEEKQGITVDHFYKKK